MSHNFIIIQEKRFPTRLLINYEIAVKYRSGKWHTTTGLPIQLRLRSSTGKKGKRQAAQTTFLTQHVALSTLPHHQGLGKPELLIHRSSVPPDGFLPKK